MSVPICIEDKIAEQLKDVCDYKARFLVSFDYGYITVEEIKTDPIPMEKIPTDLCETCPILVGIVKGE